MIKLKYSLAFVLICQFFLANTGFAQSTIKIFNGAVNTCNLFIVDTDSLQGHYPYGVTTITVNSSNSTRLAYSLELFTAREPNDYVKVFDGPSTSSPELIPAIPGSDDVESTGSTITIQFRSFSSAQSNPGFFRAHVRCITTPGNFPVFQPLSKIFAGGNIQLADYDKDGDKDMLIGGEIFRNDSYFDSLYLFERIRNPLDKFTEARMASADFDGDGFKDIFITGNNSITPTATIYRNNGNNTFTRVTTQSFAGARDGAVSIVDFNKDGKPDICYTGSSNYNTNNSSFLIFKIYLNNGNMNFSDANVVLPGVKGLFEASMSWADSDGDGDEDLVINGHDNNSCMSLFFTRNGSVFTNVPIPLTNVSDGRIVWSDINKDGKPDIANCGVKNPGNIDGIAPEILINNGNNNFTRIVTNIPNWSNGSFDWIDYDGDNDEDVVFGGLTGGNTLNTAVFKNNGNGQFTRIDIVGPAKGLELLKWLDFNHDGKYDLYLSGDGVGPAAYNNGNYAYMVKNMGGDVFKTSSFPMTSGTAIADDFNNDGLPDVFLTGIADVDCVVEQVHLSTNALVISRDWTISGIPNFTNVVNLVPLVQPANSNIYFKYWKWGDFDSDGKLDVIMTTDGSGLITGNILMFKNNGNNNFTLAFNSSVNQIPLISSTREVAIFDIDNDGVNEMLALPNKLYKWVSNRWENIYTDTVYCSFGYCEDQYIAVADYNNDGYMDAMISNGGLLSLLKNNKAGRMVYSSSSYLGAQSVRQLKWSDIDNDGDPDLAFSEGILENRNGEFFFYNSGIDRFSHTAIGDFNGDGYKDLLTIPRLTNYGLVDFYYSEQGTFFFLKKPAGDLVHVFSNLTWNEDAESFDMDNDGDDDIVHTSRADCSYSSVIVNEYNMNNRMMHVVSPNGGELLGVNAAYDIKWYGSQIGNSVTIEISRDSGLTWQIITASAPSTKNGGTYQWNVTSPFSNKCLVRITDNSNPVYTDKSNAVFSINNAPPVANAGADVIICKGNSTTIGAAANGNNTYSWTSNIGGFTSALSNPVVSPLVTTTYYLTVSNASFSAKDTVIVTVQNVTINLPDTLINLCTGDNTNIGPAAQQGFSYSWSSLPAGFISALARPNVSPVVNTTYYLTQKHNASSCQATAQVKVLVDSCIHGVISVYPNPAKDYIIIQLDVNNTEPKYFELFDATGKLVVKQELNFRTTIDTRSLLPGIYFYTIRIEFGTKIKSGKIIVRH